MLHTRFQRLLWLSMHVSNAWKKVVRRVKFLRHESKDSSKQIRIDEVKRSPNKKGAEGVIQNMELTTVGRGKKNSNKLDMESIQKIATEGEKIGGEDDKNRRRIISRGG